MKLQVWEEWSSFESKMFDLGTPFFFSAEGKKMHFDVEYPEKVVLLFGKETAGLNDEIRTKYEA